MSEFLEYSLLGLLSGGVMALIALSFVLIYKGTGVVNFAVGEVMMLGAYIYYAGAVTFGLAPWIAFVLSLVVIGLLVVGLERAVLRPLSGQPAVAVLMATIGMASIVHGGVEAFWGGDTLSPPTLLPRTPLLLGEVLIPGTVLGNFAVAAILIGGFLAFFRYSKTGIALRATASDPVTAATLGININYSQRLTWVLSGLVGTVAGVLIASSAGLSPLLAAAALSVFAAIILGGLDSILGAIVASLLIGWVEAVSAGYLGGKSRDIVPYVVVLAILVVKPYGMFGTRTIERL
ncbi:branched-chain amino acid ABC transporter permease [Variovorax sp. J22P168]|uniref:branched-chain amino acid ABC transporter permease n=1 Tax=Variovorax jilinensis TaxID=3053513 RepID=UPI002576B181|nr:branched-chain amino acid ABC transporter permease [Variovorax sp. J22P168]MDM0015118.1 branched-chain amino acid ABC transporter permease [Variovorax sp. J22P168]